MAAGAAPAEGTFRSVKLGGAKGKAKGRGRRDRRERMGAKSESWLDQRLRVPRHHWLKSDLGGALGSQLHLPWASLGSCPSCQNSGGKRRAENSFSEFHERSKLRIAPKSQCFLSQLFAMWHGELPTMLSLHFLICRTKVLIPPVLPDSCEMPRRIP